MRVYIYIYMDAPGDLHTDVYLFGPQVYHHAARMNEQKDAILQAIAGGEVGWGKNGVATVELPSLNAARNLGFMVLECFRVLV